MSRFTNLDFAKELLRIAREDDTTYLYGGYGQTMTPATKAYFKILYPKKNNNPKEYPSIVNGIDAATSNTHGYDCNGEVKGTINRMYTGKTGYTKTPCEDKNIEQMLKDCTDISEDMAEIEVGEYLVFADLSHCGIYVGLVDGKRCAVECTFAGTNGVQIIDIDSDVRSKNPNPNKNWKYHGKLTLFFDYPIPHTATQELKEQGDLRLKAKRGDENDFVKAVQNKLFTMGYSYVNPCGYFGDDTMRAVKDFQNKNGISGTGVIDTDTYNALLKA